MELGQLKYFLAVANIGKISKAAELLHVSPSTISMAITKLEAELETNLFVKIRRNIQLTDSGKKFLSLISPAMAELDFAKNAILGEKDNTANRITLSVELPAFATFLEEQYILLHPSAKFQQSLDTAEECRNKVRLCQIDFAITLEPIQDESISSVCLMDEPVLAQLPPGSEFSSRAALSLVELNGTPLVSLCAEYSLRRWMDRLCNLAGFHPHVYIETSDSHSMSRMVTAGKGFTFVGKSTVDLSDAVGDPLTQTIIPLEDTFCRRQVYITYHNNRIFTQEAQSFLDFSMYFRDNYLTTGDIVTAMQSARNV